jgi:hypothetical protein
MGQHDGGPVAVWNILGLGCVCVCVRACVPQRLCVTQCGVLMRVVVGD